MRIANPADPIVIILAYLTQKASVFPERNQVHATPQRSQRLKFLCSALGDIVGTTGEGTTSFHAYKIITESKKLSF